VNESKPNTEAGVSRRRRVLRGAIAAPVVLTVSSGASATMASNLRCVNNQVNNPTSLTRTTPAGTGVPSTVIRVKLYSQGTKFYFSGTEVQGFAHPSRPFSWILDGQWQEFNPTTNLHAATSPTTLTPAPTITSPVRYAVVQMDQNGNILRVGANTTTTTSMMAATCWNSFRAGL
jgi:hypothetical protein